MYAEIGVWRFLLGLLVILIPAWIIEQINPRWAWGYVLLILLGMTIANRPAMQRWLAFLQAELNRG